MEILQHTDVYRTYDVTSILSLPTTLDRLAEMLKGAEGHSEVRGLMNVEDEVYVAAAMGCTMGIHAAPTHRNEAWRRRRSVFQWAQTNQETDGRSCAGASLADELHPRSLRGLVQ